jgi:hypothetical protein
MSTAETSTSESLLSSSEIPPQEDASEPSTIIPDTGCSTVVDKYTDLLPTEQQKKAIVDKVNYYYSMKKKALKKRGTCPLCNKGYASTYQKKSDKAFVTEYNEATYCRTLEIKCFAASPCNGWRLVYGVVFNLEEMVRLHRSQIEDLKRAIIVNKNDLMFGYKARKEAIDLHETLIAQLEGIMDTYSTRLYKYLSYANNNRMNEDIDKINRHITNLTKDIKQFVVNAQIKEAVEASLAIKSDYVCMRNLKQLQENSYREFLFNCKSQFVEEETEAKNSKKKASKEKETIERTQKKKTTDAEKEKSAEDKRAATKKKKIDQDIQHLFMTHDMIDELLEYDPDFLEQTAKEISKLKLMLKKHGSEEQLQEFKTIEELFAAKIREVEQKREDKEKEEHDKISNLMTAGEDDDALKLELEGGMEELF